MSSRLQKPLPAGQRRRCTAGRVRLVKYPKSLRLLSNYVKKTGAGFDFIAKDAGLQQGLAA